MAVLKAWRGAGVGTAILECLMTAARSRGMPECHMHAQSQALAFYARYGFESHGDEFQEAGISHRHMRLRF